MENAMFDDLLQSVSEAREILQHTKQPSRSFIMDDPDAKAIRTQMQLTQDEFAGLLNISVNTLRNWEQSRRKPEGPARVLLGIAATHPEVFAH
ncbi:MAG: NadS family protein [Campylobacterales bacterium]|nr:NadS family protein [Campylobacterales bacterium]